MQKASRTQCLLQNMKDIAQSFVFSKSSAALLDRNIGNCYHNKKVICARKKQGQS